MTKIKIESIYPEYDEVSAFKKKFCLGISMNNPFFFRRNVHLLVDWLKTNFTEGAIVIGDYLHRYNEEILTGKGGKEANEAGIKLGEEFLSHISGHQLPTEKFRIVRWKEFFLNEHFLNELDKVNWYFNNNPEFKELIISSCNDFIHRQQSRGINYKISIEDALHFSSQYIIEETAAFGIMNEIGFQAYVYPGHHLLITKRLAANECKGVELKINGITLIETRIKR